MTTTLEREKQLQKQWFQAKLAAEKQKADVVRKVKEGQGDFVLLDARDRTSYEKDHLHGALAAPLDEFGSLVAQLDPQREYVTYCWTAT